MPGGDEPDPAPDNSGDGSGKTTADPYSGGSYADTSKGTLPTKPSIDVPPIPKKDGSGGNTGVSTPSMKLLADNLDHLADLIKAAQDKVENLEDAAPGAFKEAEELKKILTGDGGLKGSYSTVMHDLRTALMDTAIAVRAGAKKYDTIEAAASMSGADLNTLMATAIKDFTKIGTDAP